MVLQSTYNMLWLHIIKFVQIYAYDLNLSVSNFSLTLATFFALKIMSDFHVCCIYMIKCFSN